ncbi:hypothetical protein KCU70_g335, partial [Aureobasidium melanogenum]
MKFRPTFQHNCRDYTTVEREEATFCLVHLDQRLRMTPTESRVVFVRCRGDAGEHREEHQAHLRRTRIGQHRAMTMGNKERRIAYPLVEIVTSKLYSRIRHNADAVCAVTCHEPTESFFAPHLAQSLAYRHLVFFAANTLNLKEDLETLKR